MIAQTNSVTQTSGQTSTPPPPASQQDPLAQKQTFLTLLVAQIKNQDPLNPTDPTQFMGQLAQFTQLEQMLGIRTDVDAIVQQMAPGGASGGPDGGADGNSTQETK